MGLCFTVGNPSEVFVEPFAGRVKATIARLCGDQIILDAEDEAYVSDELAWSGWRLLQERAAETLGPERVPNLLAMEAWQGCYLPAEVEIGSIPFDGVPEPLHVASLGGLIGELEALGFESGLPTDDDGLRELLERYQDDDDVDEDMDIQMFSHLLLAARIAVERRQILWVVK